ncbi:MAG: helix-turn-helix transcriptional regulator [Pseudomonadota bacterium]
MGADYADVEARLVALENKVNQLCLSLSSLPSNVMKDISSGENPIRAIRRWRLMTQKELAEAAGMGVNHVSRIENGAQFSMRTARSLAEALKVRLDDIA